MPTPFLSVLLFMTSAILSLATTPQNPATGKPRSEAPPRVDQYGDSLPPGVLARCGTARLRHGDTPDVMLFTPDKKQLITGSSGRLVVWDVATGKLLRKLVVNRGDKMTAMLSADGQRLDCVCGENEKAVYRQFELSTTKILHQRSMKFTGDLRKVALTRSGQLHVALSQDGGSHTILQIDLATGRELSRFTIKEDRSNTELHFSSDGQWLAASSEDLGMRI